MEAGSYQRGGGEKTAVGSHCTYLTRKWRQKFDWRKGQIFTRERAGEKNIMALRGRLALESFRLLSTSNFGHVEVVVMLHEVGL